MSSAFYLKAEKRLGFVLKRAFENDFRKEDYFCLLFLNYKAHSLGKSK